MDFTKEYEQKLTTAENAVKVIKPGDWVDYGWNMATVHDLDIALAARGQELHDVKIRGGVLMEVPEVFKIPNSKEHFSFYSWHYSGIDRKLAKEGFITYVPVRYSEIPRYYRENVEPMDVAMLQVAPMDKHGFFSFGPSGSMEAAICERAKHIIVEVNDKIPRCLGGFQAEVHISKVDAIVEMKEPYARCMPASRPATDVDKAVAKIIVNEIPNGACLQLGIGGMPNAVGSLLAESDLKDLGVHTEMYVDSFVDMAEKGIITGTKKQLNPGRQVYAFACGTQKLYDYLDDNPACMAAPVDYVNDVRVISAHDNMISINNIVNMDLYGQVNAESNGIRQITGAGGQLDYVMGAYLSKGGKSFICCSSTFKDKAGELQSRILPILHPGSTVTDTRANIQYVVTEYGMVNLKGASLWERAEKLISIAHPNFREQLIQDAEKQGIWHRSSKI
ncbi:butyryl-CoA:acetate CoA-transferase [Caproicibacterium amylolyticum]|uniref:Butyryl-CoA:acetate CoA-transferase n=1 Tax=Caproicibacterium amylolyticum TaxID=2766537 RepID=A0A7G9WKF6_9FIRM|nr:butyryl-CoA:acetate CoA-transferase [Caproicibacterium amylolyticum]QNO19168.1 butyryl-CoA:acetate CoA-transferase [Caproicibacterium amylolyticum]